MMKEMILDLEREGYELGDIIESRGIYYTIFG